MLSKLPHLSLSYWALGLSWQPKFVEILRVFAIGNCSVLTVDIGN